MAALHCCGLGLVPHLLVGARVLFWRQVGGEGSAPEPQMLGGRWVWEYWCGYTGVALASPSHSCGVPVYCLADASFTVTFSGKE